MRCDIPERLLIAVGGNAIHPAGSDGTVDQQLAIAAHTGACLLPIMLMDTELIITHGNGPVVGKILMRQALARNDIPPMSMDICVAHSQGGIAYILMQACENTLRTHGSRRHVVCLLTQVEVDPDDAAFTVPTKPVGFFHTEDEAREISNKLGWEMREDAGRGWRYVVPSPLPKHIVDVSLIETVAKEGAVVIAGGGGGIPVVRAPDGTRRGVDAVIDKDLSSALLANVLGVKVLMILTGVANVCVNYATPEQRGLRHITLAELKTLHDAGEFAAGSMAPKVDAAIRFLTGGGQRAVIAHLDDAEAALYGDAGTQIVYGTGH
ncbi:MAG: carbamate kinase [Gammaproteobacteria bacterium]|nr:carbamate kinase [Gammaproteobacteria bacterium]